MILELSNEEMRFLKQYLISNNYSAFEYEIHSDIIIIQDNMAVNLQESLIEEMHNHFDKQYNVTPIGIIIESLIDKIYDAL